MSISTGCSARIDGSAYISRVNLAQTHNANVTPKHEYTKQSGSLVPLSHTAAWQRSTTQTYKLVSDGSSHRANSHTIRLSVRCTYHPLLHTPRNDGCTRCPPTNSPSAGDDQTCTCTQCSSSDYSPVRLVLLPLHYHLPSTTAPRPRYNQLLHACIPRSLHQLFQESRMLIKSCSGRCSFRAPCLSLPSTAQTQG